MKENQAAVEAALVNACLSQSQEGWDEFYRRYVGLVRSVVRRKLKLYPQETDDIVQTVFEELINALQTFDHQQPLTRFIVVIAERVCVNHYHWSNAAKRDARTTPVDHVDGADEEARMIPADGQSQEDILEQEQLKGILKQALWDLSHECWKIIQLREFQGHSYKEIADQLGQKENTINVKARRCLEALKAKCHVLVRKGCKVL